MRVFSSLLIEWYCISYGGAENHFKFEVDEYGQFHDCVLPSSPKSSYESRSRSYSNSSQQNGTDANLLSTFILKNPEAYSSSSSLGSAAFPSDQCLSTGCEKFCGTPTLTPPVENQRKRKDLSFKSPIAVYDCLTPPLTPPIVSPSPISGN